MGLIHAGCQSTATESAAADVSPGAVALCTGCGQAKGSEMCCKPGEPTCSKCGLVKGSPGCCAMEKVDG
jgi:hypothetical protein